MSCELLFSLSTATLHLKCFPLLWQDIIRTGRITISLSQMNNSKQQPRGIRNNNPLNIRKGNTWIGERYPQVDRSFEEFETMEYGLRAAFKLMRNYITGFGGKGVKYNTIRLLIRRWAPPSENATQNYIDFVCSQVGKDQREIIWFSDRKLMVSICRAMAFVECGQWIDKEKFESAYDMLL